MLKIGFATEYYTLWDCSVEKIYTTDAYGNHWHTGNKYINNYIQNISTDLDKAKAKYPDLTVDEDLRGHTRSWESSQQLEDPCPHILKFGRHNGKDVAEVAKIDLPYALWLLENANNLKLREIVANLPEVLEHDKKINEKLATDLEAIHFIKESGVYELQALTNPKPINNWDIEQTYSNADNGWKDLFAVPCSLGDHHRLILILPDAKYYPGDYRYPEYYLPVIDGKIKRMKNKILKMDIELLETKRIPGSKNFDPSIIQFAKLKSIVK